jgi:hypothetical protein
MSDSEKSNEISDNESVKEQTPKKTGRFGKISEKKSKASANNAKKMAPARQQKRELEKKIETDTNNFQYDYLKDIDNYMKEDNQKQSQPQHIYQPLQNNDIYKVYFDNINKELQELKNLNYKTDKRLEYVYKRQKNKDISKDSKPKEIIKNNIQKKIDKPKVDSEIEKKNMSMHELMSLHNNNIFRK